MRSNDTLNETVLFSAHHRTIHDNVYIESYILIPENIMSHTGLTAGLTLDMHKYTSHLTKVYFT